MTIRQISAFLENRKGSLHELTRALAEGGVDMLALSIADTTDFGIARAIVDDTEKAASIVRSAGFPISITGVLAVSVPDRPGGLVSVLSVLRAEDVAVEYVYSLVRHMDHQAVVIVRVDQAEKAQAALESAGITLVSEEQLRK